MIEIKREKRETNSFEKKTFGAFFFDIWLKTNYK